MSRFAGFTTFRCVPQLSDLAAALQRHQGAPLCIHPHDVLQVVEFPCPHGHTKPSSFFTPSALSMTNVWCKSCQRSYPSPKWTCPCAKPWHQCTEHFSIAVPDKRARRQEVPRQRTNAQSLSALQGLETTQAQSSKLCFSPGPKLLQRFQHLVSTTSKSTDARPVPNFC